MNPKLAKIRSVLAAKQKRDANGRFASEGNAIASAVADKAQYEHLVKSGAVPDNPHDPIPGKLRGNLKGRIQALKTAAQQRIDKNKYGLETLSLMGDDRSGSVREKMEQNLKASRAAHHDAGEMLKAMGEEPPIDTSDLPRTGVYDKRFQVQTGATDEVRQHLEDWKEHSDKFKDPNSQRDTDNTFISSVVRDQALHDAKNFRAVRDKDGRVQAGSIISDHGDHLYLEYLATAPWNVPGQEDHRTTKGSGSAMIEALVHESMKMGHGGRVHLTALHGAVPFYEKIGFKKKSGSGRLPKMELTPEAAQEFLRKRKQANS